MIYPYDLSDETNKLASSIEEASDNLKPTMEKQFSKFTSDIYDDFTRIVQEYFSINMRDHFEDAIASEARRILTGFMLGDLKVLKDTNLLSEYTCDSLHEIRLKIWETCGTELQQIAFKEQQKQIEELKKDIENYMRYR